MVVISTTFFFALELDDFAALDTWNLLPEATGMGVPARLSSRRSSCAGTGPSWVIHCTSACVRTHTHVSDTSPPLPPLPFFFLCKCSQLHTNAFPTATNTNRTITLQHDSNQHERDAGRPWVARQHVTTYDTTSDDSTTRTGL